MYSSQRTRKMEELRTWLKKSEFKDAKVLNAVDLGKFMSECSPRPSSYSTRHKSWQIMTNRVLYFNNFCRRHRHRLHLVCEQEASFEELTYLNKPSLVFPVGRRFLLDPKFMHTCSVCQFRSSSRISYMPTCSVCQLRFCSQECFQNHLTNNKCTRTWVHKAIYYLVLVLDSMHFSLMDAIDASPEFNTPHLQMNTPFFEIRAQNIFQGHLVLRPLAINKTIKQSIPDFDNDTWKCIMTKPYTAIVLIVCFEHPQTGKRSFTAVVRNKKVDMLEPKLIFNKADFKAKGQLPQM
jgi:hypothetical protein